MRHLKITKKKHKKTSPPTTKRHAREAARDPKVVRMVLKNWERC